MPDSTISQTLLAYSTALEAAFNTNPVLATDFTAFETQARLFFVPNVAKSPDVPRVGAGAASAYPSDQRSSVLEPPAIDIQDVVNVEHFPIFERQHMGQTEVLGDIEELDVGIAYRHHHYKQNFDNDGRQLDSRSIIARNNGATFIYTGCVSNSLQIQQTGIEDPQFTAGFVGSGNYVDYTAIAPPFGQVATPTRDGSKDMLGAETIITYNDGGAKSLQGRWISFSWTSNNNIQTQNLRAGLPRVNAETCPTNGWYRNQLLADDETYSLEIRIAHDDAMDEWDDAQRNVVLTDFFIDMRGNCIPTTTNDTQYAVGIRTGKCYFRNVRGADDNNDAVLDIAVFGVRNGTHFGVHKFEIVDGSNAIIV